VRVELLTPDVAPASSASGDGGDFARALDLVGDLLSGANRAEDAFARGSGDLQNAVYERARADVALSVAAATAQRVAQTVQSLLNMQI
jgi:flagellar hook-basal body complex protein FliE